MKIISWNINSLRLRIDLLEKLIAESHADIICLQETKVDNSQFPVKQIKDLGFDYIAFDGQKSYNGVAIIAKIPLLNIENIDIGNYNQARHLKVDFNFKNKNQEELITLHNFYIPAGGDIPDPIINNKFAHKLNFIDWMIEFFKQQKLSNKKIIILGDFNIAPLEHDVWSHKQLLNIVSHTKIEIDKLKNLRETLNFIDTHRHFVNEKEKLYSWWSYRGLEPIKSNRGRRLDHIWCSPNLKNNIKDFQFFQNYRTLKSPSDHIPIATIFE